MGIDHQDGYGQRLFSNHAAATRFAKALAARTSATATVKRCHAEWQVRWPMTDGGAQDPAESLKSMGCSSRATTDDQCDDEMGLDFESSWEDEADTRENDSVLDEIREEIIEGQEDWARSEEDGWYYSDAD
jgi:hypothetical protein